MSRSKTSAKKAETRNIPPSGTSRLFASRKPSPRAALITSERIAADLAAFRRSGGRIQVLDSFRNRSRSGVATPTPAAASRGRRKG